MNILQIVSKLDTGDRAQDVIASAKYLELKGHKVIVVSQKRTNIFFILFTIFKISRIILKENIQILHSRDATASFISFFAIRLAQKSREDCNAEMAFIATIYNPKKRGFFERSQFWAKRVICFSENAARKLVKDGSVSREKLRVIPPFVRDLAETPVPTEHRNGLTIGAALAVSSPEATENFIKAISILSRTTGRMKVFVIPDSEYEEKDALEKLKVLIKRYSLGSIITLLAKGDKTGVLSGFDLFVQMNSEEYISTGLMLSAQAAGVPVITTRTGWVLDYIEDRKTGIVCEAANPKELAAKILDLYKNEKLKNDITGEAKKYVKEKFDIKKAMDSTICLYGEALSCGNMLVIKIGALGDAILAVPSVRAIKEHFPKSRLKVLVATGNREVFMNLPFVDEIIACDFRERDKGFSGLMRLAKRLRAEDFDAVIDLQNNKKSHLLSFLSLAPRRYGYDNGKLSFLLNRKIKDKGFSLDPIEHQSRVLGLLGIKTQDKTLELWSSKEDEEWADSFLESHWVKERRKLMAVNIGVSPKRATKLWPAEYFAEVCNRLARDFGMRPVLIGSEPSSTRIEEFLKRAKCKPINALAKTNIPRLASLVKRCGFLLSSDSAPIHVAASVGTPFVALFGPTDPKRHLAPAAKNCVVLKKDLKCSPCYRSRCGYGYKCMRSIKPDEVYEAVVGLLNLRKETLNPKH